MERSNALVNHPLVTAVHLTGGKATHDVIVWGANPKEQKKNKENNTPVLKVPMTSELGAVSPWVIVPARYTTAELKSQAGLLVSLIYDNAFCNCNAPKVVVISETWEQKDDFLKVVEDGLAEYMLPVPLLSGLLSALAGFSREVSQRQIDL
jgi:acyl-CoA reductase-like NAD-dependent aldehyde dehydrogenase